MTPESAEAVGAPTPILDRQAPMPPVVKAKGSALGCGFKDVVLFVVLTGLFVWKPSWMLGLWAWVLAPLIGFLSFPFSLAGLAGLVAAVFLASLATIALHEGGHALAGVAAGFRFNSLRIGRLEFHRGFRLRYVRGPLPSAWLTGMANLLPVRTDRLGLRAAVMVAGGPATNLLTGLGIGLLPETGNRFVGLLSFLSIAVGCINLIPLRSGTNLSDGARIWMLLRSRAKGERWVAMMRIAAELLEGARPESLTDEFLVKAVALEEPSPDTASAHSLAYTAALARQRLEEAAHHMEVALRSAGFASPLVRESLQCDASLFQSRKRQRVDLASAWLADLPSRTELPGMRLWAESGILEAQGDLEGAIGTLVEAERAAQESPNVALRELSHRTLQRWRAELEAKRLGIAAAGVAGQGGAPEPSRQS